MVICVDVNKLKKVNQLTATLQKHGLAATSDDASVIAGEINNGENPNESINSIMDTKKEEQVEIKPSEASPMQEGISEEKFVEVMQSFADKFSDEINSMKNKINEQEQMIHKLSNNITNSAQQQEQSVEENNIVNELVSNQEQPTI